MVSSMHGNRDVDRDGRHLQRPRVEFSYRTNLVLRPHFLDRLRANVKALAAKLFGSMG